MELLIFAGPNGSGKSTVVAEVLKQYPSMLYICPDDYFKLIFGEDTIKSFDSATRTKNYMYACSVAEDNRMHCIENRRSFAMETVFSKRDKLDFIQYALDRGYSVDVFYITTSDPAINIDRVKKRESEGGHFVPEEKIISRYHRSMSLLPEIIESNDVVVRVYDNSETNGSPKPVLYKNEDGIVTFFNANQRPNWCERLKDKLADSDSLTVIESEMTN
jgi:predicted ABC-type ATPase